MPIGSWSVCSRSAIVRAQWPCCSWKTTFMCSDVCQQGPPQTLCCDNNHHHYTPQHRSRDGHKVLCCTLSKAVSMAPVLTASYKARQSTSSPFLHRCLHRQEVPILWQKTFPKQMLNAIIAYYRLCSKSLWGNETICGRPHIEGCCLPGHPQEQQIILQLVNGQVRQSGHQQYRLFSSCNYMKQVTEEGAGPVMWWKKNPLRTYFWHNKQAILFRSMQKLMSLSFSETSFQVKCVLDYSLNDKCSLRLWKC